MFDDTIKNIENIAKGKSDYLNSNLFGYIILSMLAGMYVGFGIFLIFSVGGTIAAEIPALLKLVMGVSFGIALSLVIFAGSELFTGNNMIMTIGLLAKKISLNELNKVWFYSFTGNFTGSVILAFLVAMSGLASNNPANDLIVKISDLKMNAPFIELFIRGILCNILVCLAVWISIKAKSEAAKLIMIFWCLFAFISSGYEHSIANMSLLSIALMIPHPESVSLIGLFNNLIPVTLGNIVGGAVFVGMAYWFSSLKIYKKIEDKDLQLEEETA